MPFDAMKGLQAALRSREERHTRVERRWISEEQIGKNAAVLAELAAGDEIELEYYYDLHEWSRRAEICEINREGRYLRIGEEKIRFENIYAIRRTL